MTMDEIRYLAQNYFHQDWDLDASEPLGVVRNFREAEDEATLGALRRQIVDLLAKTHDDRTLVNQWLVSNAVSYDPRTEGIAIREWFLSVVRVLDGG